MKISWYAWAIISALELISFFVFSILLWMRDLDAAGASQTTELKWLNIAVLAFGYSFFIIIQIIWLILNVLYSRKHKKA